MPGQYLKLYDGPIVPWRQLSAVSSAKEIKCKASGAAAVEQGHPSGCWWWLRNNASKESPLVKDGAWVERSACWLALTGVHDVLNIPSHDQWTLNIS